jgi:hypothetical protein
VASDEDPPPESGKHQRKPDWDSDWDEESAFPKPPPKLPDSGAEPAAPISLPPLPAFSEQPPVVAPVQPPSAPQRQGPEKFASGGSMRSQDPASTRPRPATPAELRAREKYEQKQREIEQEAEPPADRCRGGRRDSGCRGGPRILGAVGAHRHGPMRPG